MTYAALFSSLLALALTSGPTDRSTPDVRKCMPPQPGGFLEPIVRVNGERSSLEVYQVVLLNRQEIFSLFVGCMDPKDSTLTRAYGVSVLSVWTKAGVIEAAKNTLAAILEAQEAHYARESRYLDKADGLTLPARPAELQVSIEASTSGWVAQTTPVGLRVTCQVYGGSPTYADHRLAARQPACFEDLTPAGAPFRYHTRTP